MKSVRQIEEVCKSAGLDPRVTMILCEIAERLKVQHQQDMHIAQAYGKLVDTFQEVVNKQGNLNLNLERAGVLKRIEDNSEQDDDPISTHEQTRKSRH